MSAVAMISGDASDDTMQKIRELAARKKHHLNPRMTGSMNLTEAAARAVLIHLNKCADLLPAPVARQEVPASAIEALRKPAPAEVRKATGQQSGRRPGGPVTEAGIFYYRDRIYKVYKSTYDGHMRAKVLTIVPKGEHPEWVAVTRILGILREEDRMTAEQSRRYEEMYGFAACKHCGLPLENDESRARRSGPKCFAKHGS